MGRVEEPGQQLDQRGLSASRRSHDRGDRPRFEHQVDPAQHLVIGFVTESDVTQFHPVPPRRDRVRGLRCRRHREHVPDPADRAPGGLQVVEAVAESRHRGGQSQPQQQEGEQIRRDHGAGRDQSRTAGQHDQQHERRRQRQRHRGGDPGDAEHPAGEDVGEIVRGREESTVGALAPAERLDDRDPLHELDGRVRNWKRIRGPAGHAPATPPRSRSPRRRCDLRPRSAPSRRRARPRARPPRSVRRRRRPGRPGTDARGPSGSPPRSRLDSEAEGALRVVIFYRDAGRCSPVYGGGEGSRGSVL